MELMTAGSYSALPLAGKMSAIVLAHGAASAGAVAGSALLTDVLSALRQEHDVQILETKAGSLPM